MVKTIDIIHFQKLLKHIPQKSPTSWSTFALLQIEPPSCRYFQEGISSFWSCEGAIDNIVLTNKYPRSINIIAQSVDISISR